MKSRIASFIFLIVGSLIFILSSNSITGGVIFDSSFFDGVPVSSLGLFVIIIGLILFVHSQSSDLENTVEVYETDAHENKIKDKASVRKRYMTDPRLNFGNKGYVSLDDFKREVDNYRQMGQDGEELIDVIRSEYEPSLKKIADSEDNHKSQIARDFLRVLNPLEKSITDSPSEGEKYEGLNSEEKREIRIAFRNWDGDLDQRQREVAKKYHLVVEKHKGNHIKIRQEGYGRKVTTSSSPSDVRTGLNLATEIVHLIEENKREEYEDRKKSD